MPRFVILEHDHPTLHWDLMLESGTVLRTWRLAAPPRAGKMIDAFASSEHRLAYLEYEGPISGDRGKVARWDGGMFLWEVEAPDRVAVDLEGARLRGVLRLVRVNGDEWQGEFLAKPCHS